MPSAPSIRLELQPSRWHRLSLAGAIVLGMIGLLLAPWPAWLRGLVLALWLLVIGFGLARQSAQPRVTALTWRADGHWRLDVDGEDDPLPLQLTGFRVFGPLVGLRLATADHVRRFSLILWPDSADGDGLRRLRIRLLRAGAMPADDAREC